MHRSILLDTNLLVLLVVGLTDRRQIATHKRTNDFAIEDYDILVDEIARYEELWVTSHTYAEASNLLRQTYDSFRYDLMNTLCQLSRLGEARESWMSMHIINSYDAIHELGVADAGLMQKAKRVTAFLTVDFSLYQRVNNQYGNGINFNYLRQNFW